jgi:hypothetical protein
VSATELILFITFPRCEVKLGQVQEWAAASPWHLRVTAAQHRKANVLMFFVWQNDEKERKQKIEIYRNLPGRSADLTKFLPTSVFLWMQRSPSN